MLRNRLYSFVAFFSLFGLLPSCSLPSAVQTFSYARSLDLAVAYTSVDVYECDSSFSDLVVYVHGGAWIKGDKANVHEMPKFFQENKICFASINYPLRSPDERPLMEHQLDALLAFNDWLAAGNIRSKSFERISILGHSAGAHLVALFDKRFGWNDQVDNLMLMDSASYDLNLKYNRSSPRFKNLLSELLRLDLVSFDSYPEVFRDFSPGLLPPLPRSQSEMNIVIFSGLRADARQSGRMLGDSYSASSDYVVRYFDYPWRHRDFPRKIGVDSSFGNQLLTFVRG